jgi:type III pantothenate kinase
VPEWIASQRRQCGVDSRYADPAQLGSDRWAALIGARARTTEACIVVNTGTAATIDALSGAGEFLGGLIVPGPDLMAEALAQGTARLGRQAGQYERFPSNTQNAICTGAIQALCGAIERMQANVRDHAGQSAGLPRLFMSGGGAAELVPHLRQMPEYVPALVLEGLIVIAQE